mmetsp:Transcript_15204/g.30319  ORF Transcript_15204/g.30319 Transcript_15204/m.30319 type:complete len:227 (-) Transcript_15204:40-720(-)
MVGVHVAPRCVAEDAIDGGFTGHHDRMVYPPLTHCRNCMIIISALICGILSVDVFVIFHSQVPALAVDHLVLEPVLVESRNWRAPVGKGVPVEELSVVGIGALDRLGDLDDFVHRHQPEPRHVVGVRDRPDLVRREFAVRPVRFLAVADPLGDGVPVKVRVVSLGHLEGIVSAVPRSPEILRIVGEGLHDEVHLGSHLHDFEPQSLPEADELNFHGIESYARTPVQ